MFQNIIHYNPLLTYKEINIMEVTEKSAKAEISELLNHTAQETVYSFIAEYAVEDKRFYEKIKAVLLPDDDEGVCDMDYYREKAEDCFDFDNGYGHHRSHRYDFYEAAYQAARGLDAMLSDASFLAAQGKYANAAAMAMSVAKIIPQNYNDVDDSSGSLGGTFSEAIKLLCDIVNNPAVAISVKRRIYDWSKTEANDSVYLDYGFDDIQTIYDRCYEQLGNTEEVLADIDRQIKEAKSDYNKSKAVLRKIRFMQSRDLDVSDVIKTHLDLNKVRKIRFKQLTEANEYDEALRLAERGIEIAHQQAHPGTVSDWQKSKFDIYLVREDTANLLPMAEYMFLHAGWNYNKDEFYTALKKYTPKVDWPATMERLLASAEKGRHFDSFAAQIMHEHQLWPRLFAYCKTGGIEEIEKYEPDLKPYFEKEILALYHEDVENQALIANWHAYEVVADRLKRMRTFAGGNELVNRLLEKYRTTYKRRKNMIEALKDV